MKKTVSLLGFCFFLMLVFPSINYSWDDSEVHPILSKAAILNSVLTEQYLEKTLGIKNGINELISDKLVFQWIMEGSELEDLFPRFLNHFHNPIHRIESWDTAGLDDFWYSGQSSVLWAQDGSSQQNVSGSDWSWERIRDSFYQSLTAVDHETKDKELANTLLGLGHQIHLLQDMAVPAHVRNDAHPLPFNKAGAPHIEKWAAKNTRTINEIAGRLAEKPNVSLYQSTVSNGTILSPIARLSDNDQYDGSNPSTSDSMGLAEYTNANFFSDDTIFTENADNGDPHGFPFPKKASTDLQSYIDENKLPTTIIAKDGVEDTGLWISKTVDGETIDHFAKPTYFTYEVSPETHASLYHRLFYLDEACHQDYAEKLIPRAIGYSAALLDYFFRGRLQVTSLPYFYDNSLYTVQLKITNSTPTEEAMVDGNFNLVFRYTPVGGNPDGSDDVFVPADERVDIAELPFNASTDIFFYPGDVIPVECWDSVTCTLAFEGTLGNEVGAVVGKVFSAGDVLFNEEWDNGLGGNYAWESSPDNINVNNGWSTRTVADGRLIMETIRSIDHETARTNDLWIDLTTDGSDGLLITPTTYLQFIIDEMSTSSTGTTLANHIMSLKFNDGLRLQYADEGPFLAGNTTTVYLGFVPGQIINDNIISLFQNQGIPVPDPLYLKDIGMLQQVHPSPGEYHLRMDVDAIRVVDLQME